MVRCVGVLGIVWVVAPGVRAQLVITEDTVITETVPGFTVRGGVMVRIAPGGRVEGDIHAFSIAGQGIPTIVVDGGVVAGSFPWATEGDVIVKAGLVTGDIGVHLYCVQMEGGVVLGTIGDGTGFLVIKGGFVAGDVYGDAGAYMYGGTVGGNFGEGDIYIAGGRLGGEIIVNGGLVNSGAVVDGVSLTVGAGRVSGRLLDGTDLAGGKRFQESELYPLTIQNHPNALYLSPSDRIVGSCTGVDITVVLVSDCDAEGLSFGIAHESEDLAPDSVEVGAALASLRGGIGPEYLQVDTEPVGASGITFAAIGSILDPVAARVPAGPAREIARIHYDVLPEEPIGLPSTFIELVDDLVPNPDTEPVARVLSCEGERVPLAGNGISLSLAPCFVRADANADGYFDLSDAITTLLWLFAADRLSAPPLCLDALDTNDDSSIALDDAVLALARLFTGGAEPAAPFRACGVDPSYDGILCDVATCR